MLATSSPFPQYFDLDGSPLDNGSLYFGTANGNPLTAPITVYLDSAGTQPAAQPIRTMNGFAVLNGTPVLLYVSGDYSLLVNDKRGRQVAYSPSGIAASAAQSLASDLADASNVSKGAAMVGFNVLLSYAAGTVGAALRSLFSTVAALPWANVTGTPTTKAGYGLTDVPSFSELVTHRNRIINGNFAIKQDTTYASGAAVPSSAYIHDQWKAGAGGGTATWATSGLDTTLTITAGTFVQPIEAAFVEGGTYTLSWSGTAQARIDGGSYAASPITVTGKTAATQINIEFGTGTVTKVQFEPGAYVTAFERRDDELRRCYRYYVQEAFYFARYGASAGSWAFSSHYLPATMRANPTCGFVGAVNYGSCSAAAINIDGPRQLHFAATIPAATEFNISGNYYASARL